MTDGRSVGGSDARRTLLYDAFLDSVRDYVRDPTDTRLDSVKVAAKTIDDIPNGFAGPTRFAAAIDEKVRPLGARDSPSWQAFLRDIGTYWPQRFAEFAALAPFGRDHLE